MRDALEEHLANRLGTLGDTVGDDLPLPADLELRVRRRRRHIRARRRWSGLVVAAAVVVASTTLAVVHGSSGGSSLRIESSSSTAATVPVRDALQPGTVMLSARGHFVVTLDANGHANATMVRVAGNVEYARATDDHRELWYLSKKIGANTCGDVVRADIGEGHASTIVTQAVTFDVSPDGTRLALYGAGDLAHGRCSPVKPGSAGRVVVIDLSSSASSTVAMSDVTELRWSPEGSFLVASTCGAFECGFRRIGVPAGLASPLVATGGTAAGFARVPAGSADRIVFGPDGLYELATTVSPTTGTTAESTAETTESIVRYDPQTLGSPRIVFQGGDKWDVVQVIPTSEATYVVAAPVSATKSFGMYRIVARKLVFVRSLDGPGTLTPVAPLSPTG